MLTYRKTVITFALILLVVLGIDYLVDVNKWIYAGIIGVFLILIAWGSKNINSGFYMKTVNHGDRNKNSISLTFDDGPDAQVTPMILEILKKHQVKATFFVIGSKAEQLPDLIKQIDKEGHLLGSHSYSHHFFFDLFLSRTMQAEMIRTENFIYSCIGKRMKLFRPPYGVTNPPLAKAVRRLQYWAVGWSLKSDDTVIKDEHALVNRVTSRVQNGDIILFHDNKPWNVRALDEVIFSLKEKNYQILRLDELLNLHAYVY